MKVVEEGGGEVEVGVVVVVAEEEGVVEGSRVLVGVVVGAEEGSRVLEAEGVEVVGVAEVG